MKKVLLLGLLAIFCINVLSQENPYDDKGVIDGVLKEEYEKYLIKDLSLSSGDYLQKSSNCLLLSTCFSIASAGMISTAYFSKDHAFSALMYGTGGVMSLLAVYKGIKGVVYLNRAGKKLNLEREQLKKEVVYIEPSSSGIGIKFTF
jgi:hypothetical protein